MSLKLSSIKRNRAQEDEGQWENVVGWPGVRVKVRGINYKPYQIAREMMIQKLTRTMGRQPTSTEMEPMLGKLVATHLLLGWDGIVDGPEDDESKQTPVEWTMDVGVRYLTDRDYLELEQRVIIASVLVGERDAEFTADATKNSAAPSATN